MAALRMESRSDARKLVTRLGHRQIVTCVHTWRTFVNVTVRKDGSAEITVTRDGVYAGSMDVDAEGAK